MFDLNINNYTSDELKDMFLNRGKKSGKPMQPTPDHYFKQCTSLFVFEELFSFKCLKINMSTIFKYLDTKEIKSIKVTDLILLALEKNQIFIGYVFQDKLHLNPPKSEEISVDESLELVYIG